MLGSQSGRDSSAFNRTYQNFPIRAGIVIQRYELDDKNNLSKLAIEYDVIVIEQDRNMGTMPITYKNCLSSESLGSIGDFFEKKLVDT